MRKEVKHYQGKKIDIYVLSELFAICAARNFRVEGHIPYEEIDSVEDFSLYYNCNIEDIHIVLGQDWFISYIDWNDAIEIMEWVSLENSKDKFKQTLEMMKYIIEILLQTKNRQIDTIMRHSSSYSFYELLKKRGYIEEQYNAVNTEASIPQDISEILRSRIQTQKSIIEYLKDETRDKEYDQYFHHDVTFSLTDKFFCKYSK